MTHLASAERYERMQYRRCGRSGLLLPAIALGLWHNFGEVDPYDACRAIVLDAFDRGITHFDLANNYGPPPGSAEVTFGRILRDELASHRDELIVSSKAGYLMWPGPYGNWGSRKHLTASLDQSLQRLGLEYVDIFYHHRPDPDTPLEETLGALAHAVQSGKALHAGVSSYPPDLTRRAAALLREMGVPCLVHQPKYSMLHRSIEDGLLEVVEEEGIGCVVFSPLAQGLLTDRYLRGVPGDSRAAKPHGFLRPEQVTDAVLTKVRRLNELALGRGQSLAQLAIAWVLRHSQVTSAIVGASRQAQLDDVLGSLSRLTLSADELTEIDRILAG
jgi:L-glyceraldehyde 3-phosphate reductase